MDSHIHIAALYKHTHSGHIFLVHRTGNGWVYTSNLMLGKDKSVPITIFNRWFTLMGDVHD